jgi:hypothetical protein
VWGVFEVFGQSNDEKRGRPWNLLAVAVLKFFFPFSPDLLASKIEDFLTTRIGE